MGKFGNAGEKFGNDTEKPCKGAAKTAKRRVLQLKGKNRRPKSHFLKKNVIFATLITLARITRDLQKNLPRHCGARICLEKTAVRETAETSEALLRRVCPAADAPQIAEIYNDYVLTTTISFETAPLSPEAMQSRIESIAAGATPFPYFVAADQAGRILGYAYAHPWKERAAYAATWETTIYLRPDAKGGGLGKRLMEALIADCRARRCHVLIACITAENAASCRFHESLGFRRVSLFEEVGRKQGRWLDVADYQLTL